MKQTLQILNDLQRDGFISRYAIGGAVAAIFYTEATDTEDLDIFVHIKESTHPLMPMADLYAELRRRGFHKDGIYDVIGGVPVQFLPDSPELITEAVLEAKSIDFDGTPTKVIAPEHLVAIMVHTGRLKDRVRVLQMQELASLDENKLFDILSRYSLLEKYKLWNQTNSS